MAFTMLNRWWERIFIVAFSCAMGILMNWVRVVLIAIWHYDSAKAEVHGPHGIYELPFIFLVGVFITLAVARMLARRSTPAVRPAGSVAAARGGMAASGTIVAGAPRGDAPAIAALVVLVPTAVFLATWEPRPVPLAAGFSGFPMQIAGFAGKRIEELGPPFRKGVAQDEFAARYVGPSGSTATIFLGYFPFQNDERELIDYRFNWLHEGARPIDVPTAPPTPMKVARVKVDGRPVTAYFHYDVNGRQLVDPKLVKLASLIDALGRRRTNGAIVVVLFEGAESEGLSNGQHAFLEGVLAESRALLPGT
jgi:exosortase/archaeosortase family protein